MIKTMELIVTDLSKKGTGLHELSPVRSLFEVYTKEGTLLAQHDSQGNYSVEDLIAFGKLCMSKSNLPIEKIFKEWKG
ncbi:hypothetical protein [Runella zeae]|uniref:hypothetical protein n=1 Tax=Runella zeae TaxID=94255 RepID=UPI00048BA735|nr:hypothetical protein [Runella zeae]